LKSKQCSTSKNRYYCPEIFLDVVSSKLTSTAVLFLNVELLSEFNYNFPRELDVRLGRGLSKDEVERFAREDPRVKGHLDVIRRKELLEMCLGKMKDLRDLEVEERGKRKAGKDGRKDGRERKGWSLF
jgi:dynamin-like GTPase MGM1, mitochondrial